MDQPEPITGLIIALILIALVYWVSIIFSSVSTLVDPISMQANTPAVPRALQATGNTSGVKLVCRNGYLFYDINGTLTKVPSLIKNPCVKELNDAAANPRKSD